MGHSKARTRNVGAGFYEHDERINYFVKYRRKQNFGDYLPEIICKELLTYPRIEAEMFRLIGSVINEDWIRRDLLSLNGYLFGTIAFWCCGARDTKKISQQILSHCQFFGVRGPLTRDLLGLPSATVLGDPGLLAPLFHKPKLSSKTAGKTICIPHIHDTKSDEMLIEIAGTDVLIRPEIEASEHEMRNILDCIASAKFVLTASLHGAIIAAAYKRPFCFWDNGHIDILFKWHDFAGSVNIPAVFARNLRQAEAVWEAKVAPVIVLPSLADILDVAPFVPRPSSILRAKGYDMGEADKFAGIAAMFDELPSMALPQIYCLQSISTERRNRSRSLLPVVGRSIGSPAIRTVEKLLRYLLCFRRRLIPSILQLLGRFL